MLRKKIVGYCRVSTLEQQKKGFGLDIQVREIEKFAKDNHLKIDRIFKDKAVSGIKESRKGLNALRDLCRRRKIGAVIFPSTDRTARSVRISENLYYELNKADVKIYFADMPFYDSDNYGDIMVRQIKEVIAEGNRNALVERLKRGREERARKGKPSGGTIPYGYIRENKQLKINPAEASIVNIIYSQAKSGQGGQEIADYLNQQGYCRRNGKGWVQRQVCAILHQRELHTQGIIRYGEGRGKNRDLIIVGE